MSKTFLCPKSEYNLLNFIPITSGSVDNSFLVEKLEVEYIGRMELEGSAYELPSVDFSSGAEMFTAAMHQHSLQLADALLQQYDLKGEFGLEGFLDIAGGSGCFWYVWLDNPILTLCVVQRF